MGKWAVERSGIECAAKGIGVKDYETSSGKQVLGIGSRRRSHFVPETVGRAVTSAAAVGIYLDDHGVLARRHIVTRKEQTAFTIIAGALPVALVFEGLPASLGHIVEMPVETVENPRPRMSLLKQNFRVLSGAVSKQKGTSQRRRRHRHTAGLCCE